MIHRSSIFSRPLVGLGTWVCAGLLVVSNHADAALRLTGQYRPVDNPFTQPFFNEDLDDPDFGVLENSEGITLFELFLYEPFPGEELPAPIEDLQHTFEEGDPDKVDIEIGLTAYGRMDLDAGTQLRYGHLILGGEKVDVNLNDVGSDFQGSTTGIGTVTVSGFGSVYNSNPNILPSELDFLTDPSPRPADQGYDVYVGLTGTGTLQVIDGGRVEIEDSMYVGMAPTANGYVLVSGIGSVIDQAGLAENPDGDDQAPAPHAMLIGPLGTGTMRVEEGGVVNGQAGVGIGTLGVAIKDGDDGDFGNPLDDQDVAGYGVVEVDGNGSRLNSHGGVTVGWFFNDVNQYENATGTSSRLIVSNNGRVNLTRDEDGDTADFIVGRNGVVELSTNGRVNTIDAILNDGIVTGTGQIGGGTFSNRRFGTVAVGEGEKLQFTASSETLETDLAGTYFMANNGLIDVQGGEIIFQRSLTSINDPFLNRIDPDNGILPAKAGRIHGQNATMRFRSGLTNQATLAFTAGDNTLEGEVLNELTGDILLSGATNTVFEDDLVNFGTIELGPDGTAVTMTVLGNFANMATSTLSLSMGASSTGFQLSNVMVGGDIQLGGALEVDIAATGPSPLDPQPGDRFEMISGTGLLTGAFTALDLPVLSDPTWSWIIDTSNSDFTLVVSDLIAIGGDFNGDGLVDEADLAIWEMNFGLQMGATGAMGDADGDGDVDAGDFYIWEEQLGGPPMAPGSLVGGQPVPEPSSVLLLFGTLVAGAWRLRRK